MPAREGMRRSSASWPRPGLHPRGGRAGAARRGCKVGPVVARPFALFARLARHHGRADHQDRRAAGWPRPAAARGEAQHIGGVVAAAELAVERRAARASTMGMFTSARRRRGAGMASSQRWNVVPAAPAPGLVTQPHCSWLRPAAVRAGRLRRPPASGAGACGAADWRLCAIGIVRRACAGGRRPLRPWRPAPARRFRAIRRHARCAAPAGAAPRRAR